MREYYSKRANKSKGPNFSRIEKLRDHLQSLKITKHKQFNMSSYIYFVDADGYEISGRTITKTASEVRKNGASCGSAFCMGGDAIILFAPSLCKITVDGDWRDCRVKLENGKIADAQDYARDLLNLLEEESSYMFNGDWTSTFIDNITRAQAVRYLTKVLATESIFSKLSGNGRHS